VGSLALLDPARPALPSALQAEMVRTIVEPALACYRGGDKAEAVATWMRGVCGPDYREPLEQVLPGAVDQAVIDADTFFGQELPAIMQWSFGADEAARLSQPALAVLGEYSFPYFASVAIFCSPGCRTWRPTSSPGQPTCSRSRVPAAGTRTVGLLRPPPAE
jgi:hypothetical protein